MSSPNPEVEVVWGGGGWHRSHRRYMRPFVEGAVELAQDVVGEIGIRYDHPKRARVRRCSNIHPDGGTSTDARDFEVYVREDHYRRRKAARYFCDYMRASLHEIVHSARSERYSGFDLIENVASEGIAYIAEDLAVAKLDLREERMYSADTMKLRPLIPSLKGELLVDYDSCVDEDTTAYYDELWLKGSNQIDDGTLVGIAEVHNRLIEGYTIGDIIDWPPERILDL